jgi:acyl-CoA thioesterase
MSLHEFDTALSTRPVTDGRWEAVIPDGWDFFGIPNGGLLMSLVAGTLGPLTGHPDPVTVTAHFAARAEAGEAVVEGEVLRAGRTLGTASGRIVQHDRVVAHVLATFGDLEAREGGVVYEAGLPELPPRDACLPDEPFPGAPAIFDRVGIRFHPEHTGFFSGDKPGRPEIGGWMRFRDGRQPDPLAMLLFTDAHPPAVLNAPEVSFGWVPTIELTVHVHKRPRPGWIGGWFETSHISGGFLEEEGLLWDEDGDLVAVSRQMAMVPRPR